MVDQRLQYEGGTSAPTNEEIAEAQRIINLQTGSASGGGSESHPPANTTTLALTRKR